MARIKIVKKKPTDYTFVDDSLNLDGMAEKKETDNARDNASEPDYRLRGDSKKKARFKPKIAGGHSMQGHSPVYE